ncbi:phage protein Gp37 [Bergeriella denitrificans]|uniref:Putative Gp37-like prophage protein n=1 Tax=Bergeriella denitrificans TaxID=494 RepID=A0A378UE16_BERDE|nr:phage protein Gp37 [Bergeriella denitrificans]STZ75565.1 putative Gp37-like prophage protein [Bergeriella denitrificans]
MITRIEQQISDRLRRGLGRLVRTVKSYNGELDDLPASIHTLPAVWVTYGGSRIDTPSAGQRRYQDQAEFVVMCATRSLRSEQSLRQGGVDWREIGSNDLIYAVRRLLDGQRLGLADSRGLMPKAVRPIVKNTLVQAATLSVVAVEYTLRFDSCPLDNDRYPERTDDPAHPDYLFTKYQGELSEPWPWFEVMDGLIFDPASGANVPLELDLRKDKA